MSDPVTVSWELVNAVWTPRNDSSVNPIPFDYLPNWRQHALRNDFLHVFCLVRELAGVQQENRSVAMRCHPSIQTSQISAGGELRRGSFTLGVSATITALRASAPEKPSTYN